MPPGHRLPDFARCEGELDWPALAAEHPDELAVDEEYLRENHSAQWSAITDAYTHLKQDAHHPRFDVMLGVGPDNRIVVLPMGMRPSHPLGETHPDVERVDAILAAAGGHPGRFRDGDPDNRSWLLG